MTKVERHNDDTEKDEIIWGTPPPPPPTQDALLSQETDCDFFWEKMTFNSPLKNHRRNNQINQDWLH